jgi:metallo-beta-lactamase class B
MKGCASAKRGSFLGVTLIAVLASAPGVLRAQGVRPVASLESGGCTSWSTQVRVGGVDRTAVFICSLSILGGVRLRGANATYPGIAEDFRRSYAVLRELDCEVFLASHSGFFDLESKLARLRADSATNPFLDPEGCEAYVERAEARFMERVEEEVGRR